MNSQDLEKYKTKIGLLTDEEQIERDLYLKRLADGTIQGPPVGYSSIDKPWLQYYTDDNIKSGLVRMKMYDYLRYVSLNWQKNTALEFATKKFSFSDMFKYSEKCASAFASLGVKEGDVVLINSVTLPQTVFALFGLNIIGAVSNTSDLRSDSKTLKHYIDEGNSKVVVTFADTYYNVREANSDVKIIVVDPFDLLPFFIEGLASIKDSREDIEKKKKLRNDIKNDPNALTFKEFLSMGKERVIPSSYKENQIASIIHTSGTTSMPKSIAITNENYTGFINNYEQSPVVYEPGDRILNIVPMFTAYGLVSSLYMPLCSGITDIIHPQVVEDDFPKLIRKYKPNYLLGIPMHWKYLLEEEDKNYDYSFIKIPGCGGDSFSQQFEQDLNEYFKTHNSSAKLDKGYGMTEICACAVTTSEKSNELGSVGIPFVKNNFMVIDHDTGIELPTGEVGEVCVSSPALMKEYFNNIEETELALFYDKSGTKWIRTGDLGHVGRNGEIYIDGRIKRLIVRKGFKISASAIENVVEKIDFVQKCVVVKYPDELEGEIPFAFIELKENCEMQDSDIIDYVKNYCINNLPEFYLPEKFSIIDKIPYTKNSKVDINTLENMALNSISSISKK